MAKITNKKRTATPSQTKTVAVDLDPDAWPKFEKLIKSAAKMGHKPHSDHKEAKAKR